MGSYATLQFLGTFSGALVGGQMLERFGTAPVLLAASSLGLLWLALTIGANSRLKPE